MDEDPTPRQRLYTLERHLTLNEFEVTPQGADIIDHIVVTLPEADLTITIRCRPRVSDGGRCWFVSDAGTPLAEADQVINAAMVVKGMRSAS